MGSGAALAATAAPPGRRLDPLEITCAGGSAESVGNPQLRPVLGVEQDRVLERGHYRRQYRDNARLTAWGTEKRNCGGSVLVRLAGDVVQVAPVMCDTWTCKTCSIKKAAWLRANLQRSIFSHRLKYFWTLTIRTGTCTPSASLTLVKDAWHRLCRELQRYHGRFTFAWVMERTKKGYAHLHVLCGLDVTRRELKDRWHAATGGSFMAKIKLVTDEYAANYVSKYVCQEATARRDAARDGEFRQDHVYGKSRDIVFPCFRCGQMHPRQRREGGKVCHVPCPRAQDYVPWARWDQPYKEAVELLGREVELKGNSLDGTPFAVFDGTGVEDLLEMCERVAAVAEQERAAWPERAEVIEKVDDIEPAEDMDALFAMLDRPVIRPSPTVVEVPCASASG